MPGKKRTTKSVSYTEHNDDDDDFISKNDNTKKTRNDNNNNQTESNIPSRPAPRKRHEKLSKSEQEELDLAVQLSKEPVQTTEESIEIPIINDDKESTTSESTVSSGESKTTTDKEYGEHDENSLPKSKRMKREEEEEEEDTDESESSNEDEEEEEPTPKKKPIRKTEQAKKNADIPTVTSIDLNSSRLTTRGQQKSSVPASDLPKKKSNTPVGFPTSKIIIPSVQTYRVGLSRKSSAIKSLHPNLNQRTVHE